MRFASGIYHRGGGRERKKDNNEVRRMLFSRLLKHPQIRGDQCFDKGFYPVEK